MSMSNELRVADIQRFCMYDGDGIRTTVFFKGCPLNCKWCHNPETKDFKLQLLFYDKKCMYCKICENVCQRKVHSINETHAIFRNDCIACGNCVVMCPTKALEMCGKDYDIKNLIKQIEKDVAFYGDNGGVTFSGGEPFSQGEPFIRLLKECKLQGLNVAVETCGFSNFEMIKLAIPYVDIFLWDVKDTNDVRHKEYTGVSNQRILNNLRLADSLGAKTRLRCILVNEVNTEITHYENIGKLAQSLKNCQGVEFIAYHAYASSKSTFVGESENGNVKWIPTKKQLSEAKKVVNSYNVKVFN